jgi:hypothetical protein
VYAVVKSIEARKSRERNETIEKAMTA